MRTLKETALMYDTTCRDITQQNSIWNKTNKRFNVKVQTWEFEI